MGNNSKVIWAFWTPFLAFVLIAAAGSLVSSVFKNSDSLWISSPQYWVYPLQAVVCGVIIARFWKSYSFGHLRNTAFTIAIAVLVLLLWIAPQELLHFSERTVGFDPTVFADNHKLFTAMISLRFLRLVVVVPLMEEIFWRGFLLRDLIDA